MFYLRLFAPLLLTLSFSVSADIIKGTGYLSYVVDGDTYWINADKKDVWTRISRDAAPKSVRLKNLRFKARILNIDTEESVHRNKRKNTSFGKKTSQIVSSELADKNVSFICTGVGKYKRPLCSVYLNGKDYALILIKRGLSPYVTRYGRHFSSHKDYVSAELFAKRNKLGIWGADKDTYIQIISTK